MVLVSLSFESHFKLLLQFPPLPILLFDLPFECLLTLRFLSVVLVILLFGFSLGDLHPLVWVLASHFLLLFLHDDFLGQGSQAIHRHSELLVKLDLVVLAWLDPALGRDNPWMVIGVRICGKNSVAVPLFLRITVFFNIATLGFALGFKL